MRLRLIVLVLLVVLTGGRHVGTVPSAIAVDLGGLGTAVFTDAWALNDSGQVTGRSYSPSAGPWGAYRAFITGPNGAGMRDIGTLGGESSEGRGINNSGQVAGGADRADGGRVPFVTGSNGEGMSAISSRNGEIGPGSQAYDINDAGQVVGTFMWGGLSVPAQLFWTPFIDGRLEVNWGGPSQSGGLGINNAGQIVGFGNDTRSGIGPNYAVVGGPLWNSPFTSLWKNDGQESMAYDVNDAGRMVGTRRGHAFIADLDGGNFTDLGSLGGISATGLGVNNAGQVVGTSLTKDWYSHAFVWGLDGGGMVDLNTIVTLPSGVWLTEAWDINNSGQIIANGSNFHAYLITLGAANPCGVGAADSDGDGQPDCIDTDDDNDGVLDTADNCPVTANADQADLDRDGIGDACDPDIDGDGIENPVDNCRAVSNADQSDWDRDGIGDACDPDVDGDGVANAADACPFTPVGEVVDRASGCSVVQLCPCNGPRGTSSPWKNHGQYVSCVSKASETLVLQGLISGAQKDATVSAAGGSACGGKR